MTDKLISIFFRFFIILNSISYHIIRTSLMKVYTYKVSLCNIILTILKLAKMIIFMKIQIMF